MEQNFLQAVVVYGYILNKEGKLLIAQRALGDTMPGMWEIPGGNLDFDEQIEAGIKREVKEECGIEIEIQHPIFAAASLSTRVPNRQTVRIAYLCKTVAEDPEIVLSADHQDYQWLEPEKLAGEFQVSDFLLKILKAISK